MDSDDELKTLKSIENRLIEIKTILLVVSFLLIFGVFGPRTWVAVAGLWLFGLVCVGLAVYGFLKLVEHKLKVDHGDRESMVE